MPRQFAPLRFFALKSRLAASCLILASIALLPSLATAGIVVGAMTATQTYGDDVNKSVGLTLTPIAGSAKSGVNDSGGLIQASTAAFAAANKSWSFNWGTDQAAVAAAMDGSYYVWVVTAPTNVSAGGGTYNDPTSKAFIDRYGKANPNQNEVGGALINLTTNYAVPANDATHTYSLHWIQALTGEAYGVATPTKLDNPFATNGTPYTDDGGAAGTVAGNPNAWFLDIPNAFENEYEQNPVISRTFQMVLALDDQTTVMGAAQHSVSLLGGYQWGYTYTAMDTPEVASLVMWGTFAGLGFVVYRRQRSRAPPEDRTDHC